MAHKLLVITIEEPIDHDRQPFLERGSTVI